MKNIHRSWTIFGGALVLSAFMIASAASAADFSPIMGRWQRTDGGYVIEIQRVAPDGTMEAGYFNPRPINVSKANASIFKGAIKVQMELQDVGYPGSTYTLLYYPERDALLGLYYQAVRKQTFDVMFIRRTQ